MKIALVSEDYGLLEYVGAVSSTCGCQLSQVEFSAITDQTMEFPVVVVDCSLLDSIGLKALSSFCENPRQAQTFVIVLHSTPLADDQLEALYAAHIMDVCITTESKLVFEAKIRRYLTYFKEQQKLARTQQLTRQQNELLEFHATHDGLTGIYNHLYFQETITDEFAHSLDDGTTLGLLMLDIDFFKEVNDSYGHQVGDVVLKEFALLVKDLIREDCTWCRYGGEEFMLILPEMTESEITSIGTRIRQETEKFLFCASSVRLNITVSIGCTMVTDGIGNVSALIEQADHALYQAKAGGRNCLVWYECYCSTGNPFEPTDSFSCVRDRLRATLEKTRSSALASFEAMVHSQTRDHITLHARNKLALQMVNLLCKRLNLPRNVSQSFRRAFKLHDLLRLFISDSTLQNSGSLSEAEMLAIEDQPLMLKQLTDLFDFFADERVILRYHHEYFDGSGYPEGLDGQDIPMGARLFTIVDAYVAMILPSYKRPLKDKDEVVKEFSRLSGVQFDPFLVHILLDIVGEEGFVDLIDSELKQGLAHGDSGCETKNM